MDMKTMKQLTYHIGLCVRAYPSNRQKKIIRKNAGVNRFVYNRLVAVNKEMYELEKTAPYSQTDRDRLTYLKSAYSTTSQMRIAIPFLNDPDIDCFSIANAKQDYQKAWSQFRKVPSTGFPAFKRRSNSFSYGTNCNYPSDVLNNPDTIGLYEGAVRFLDHNHIHLPILGRIRIKGSKKTVASLLDRTDFTRIGTVRVTIDECGNCFLSIALASDTPFHIPYPKTGKAVGMDMNLNNFLTDSDGTVIDTPKYLKKSEKKLKKAQRKLSRMYESAKKDNRKLSESKNYQKQRQKLAEIHKHVANQRKDFIRRIADREVKNHDFLFAEDLKVRNLMKNHRVAKAIADSGWRMFLTQLKWCATKHGRICVLVNPKNTTQTCSSCGYVCTGDDHIALGVEEWTCPECGTHHIRDLNAAINIKNTGLLYLKESGIPISLN